MNHAPVISSILSPDYLAAFFVLQYSFGENATCKILKTGINHTYLLSTSTAKFVLRVYYHGWRTESEITEELTLLNFLTEHGISVAYPIRDREGKYINQLKAPEGDRFAVLFSYADGETIRVPSEEVSYQLGTAMAKMHQLTVNKPIHRKAYNAASLVSWALQEARNHFDAPSEEMQYFERADAKVLAVFEQADAAALRYGIVHLDLWYENMKIRNGTDITIFDFDNCGNGWLFLDMAYSLMTLYRNESNKENFESKRESFYKGYELVTPISAEEKRLIPYGGLAIWLHYTGIHVQRFNDFSNQFLSPEFLKYWMQTVNQWMKYNGIEV
ncbi:phosphotransferase [Pontibacter arcticus]|uniref:Aminoglycoside phosphotransferase domain-containing protein n=1 Tax=Pontibacter arcticus TaxID=2080288 RepID=A0A364RDZ6_9BACT|nr:phosphotransferase [Pontibacter arcticus]RAU82465.1 hypothetical protein DP923_11820 [Pontibacter arcticus]